MSLPSVFISTSYSLYPSRERSPSCALITASPFNLPNRLSVTRVGPSSDARTRCTRAQQSGPYVSPCASGASLRFLHFRVSSILPLGVPGPSGWALRPTPFMSGVKFWDRLCAISGTSVGHIKTTGPLMRLAPLLCLFVCSTALSIRVLSSADRLESAGFPRVPSTTPHALTAVICSAFSQ
ncbi:hypothetical protein BV20DRAFT_686846 [Pilatotrama ljubarskyi]|nr:hypothetical protein BV20DRAFT_686846 [Pilatotrama ljubarskyi]